MKKINRPLFFYFLFIIFNLSASLSISQAAEFDTIAVPSLTDSGMDVWYKTQSSTASCIHKASTVYQDQTFNVFIFFRGYSTDKNNNLHIRYDFQIYDPDGNPTDDRAADLLAYQGPVGNPKNIILSQQRVAVVFTEKYQPGVYKIKVTAYDKNSGKTVTSETPIELIPFELPEDFKSEQEETEWVMGYYKNPTPVKAISGVKALVKPDTKWVNDNLYVLAFFRRIFSDNPFLFKNIASLFTTFSEEDQKKFLLISAISGDSLLASSITGKNKKKLKKFYNVAGKIEIPGTDGEIISAIQLDILWTSFFTTGKYNPIRKIVSALALMKYEGNLDKIKKGKIKITGEIERGAYLEAVYTSAVWSLISNCEQIPLVFNYCIFIYENEPLDENIKNKLGSILNIAQKKINEKKESGNK